MTDYPRFTGVFRCEGPTYGFLMDPVALNGQAVTDVPEIDGKPGGYFVSGTTARQTLGSGARLLEKMHGKSFSFALRKVRGDKLEAYDLAELHVHSI